MNDQPADHSEITITLGSSEALILFDMLSRGLEGHENVAELQIARKGQLLALNVLLCGLEKQLLEPFQKEYSELVERANQQLETQFED